MIIRRTKQELARFVVHSFKELSFKVNPSCRVMRQHDLFVKDSSDIDFGTKDFFVAVQALRDLNMLGFVFDQKNDANDDVFLDLVKKCLSDPTLSEDSGKRTPGRDSQFELFVAAACNSAGLTPVEHSSPDVLFSIGNLKYCIEAKRPKSIDAIDDCLHDACRQISKIGLPGIIAIDTSIAFALERDEPPLPDLDEIWELLRQWRVQLQPMPEGRFARIHADAMNLVIGRFKAAMNRRMANRPVLGIVFNDLMPRIFSDGEWGLTGASIRYPTSVGPEFDIVAEQFLDGLPGSEGDI